MVVDWLCNYIHGYKFHLEVNMQNKEVKEGFCASGYKNVCRGHERDHGCNPSKH